jgi:ATP-binding cassette subfamily B protein
MGVLIGAFVLTSLAGLRQSYLAAYVAESVLKEMRLRMFRLLQYVHPGYFQTVRTGDIMSRLTSDVGAIQFALTGSLFQGLRLSLTLVAAAITILVTDWKLGVIGMLGLPLFLLSNHFLGPAAARAGMERQRQLGETASTVQENLGAQPVVKAFGLEERMVAGYERDLSILFRSSLRLTFLGSVYGLSANTVTTAINLTVMGVGALLVIGGNLTIGTLFTFLGLMAQVIGPVQGLTGVLQGFQQATGAMDRVEELLAVVPAIRDAPDARAIGPLTHSIRLQNVSFSYYEGQPTIRNLSLSIPAGANVALVGPTGCGKSTILGLIMRFYDPAAGQVLFDGVDIRRATIDSVRGQLGIVFQENELFNISILENIRMGNVRAADSEVEAAARAAEIHDSITSLPDGYHTITGERGSRLSGGQRQRLALARAILRAPAVLILDEATSALDPRTEAAINATLKHLSRGRTTISVTHRLSSAMGADQIYVLDRGALVQQGTHDELLLQGGLYANLWNEQGGGAPQWPAQLLRIDSSRLQDVPLFGMLDAGLRATLSQHLKVERYQAGDVIVRQGDVGDKLYIVNRGQVEVVRVGSSARERPLARLQEGDYFGEAALLRDSPRNATVRARTPVEVYSLTKADFGRLMAAVPPLRSKVEHTMEFRVQALNSEPDASQPQPSGPEVTVRDLGVRES